VKAATRPIETESWPDLAPGAARELDQLSQAMVNVARPCPVISPPRLRALIVLADAEYRHRYGSSQSQLGWTLSVWLPAPKPIQVAQAHGRSSGRVASIRHRRHLRECARTVWQQHADQTLAEVAADAREAAKFVHEQILDDHLDVFH
jgi:hypothetical protein